VKPGKPSETAARIALHRMMALMDPELRPLLADPEEPYSEWFIRGHSPLAEEQLEKWRSEAGHEFYRRLGEKLDPGGPLFILLRKRYVEEQVRAALAQGVRQMVVLGAGYDTLALRLCRDGRALRAFELDHPQTQAVKRRVLQEHGVAPEGFLLRPADLARTSVEEVLHEAGFSPDQPSVFVAEGVIMYLLASEVDALFASVARLTAPGSRFVFSLVASSGLLDRESAMGRTARLVALLGEPLRSSLDPDTLPAFAHERGFRLCEAVDHRALHERFLRPLGLRRPLREAEWVAVAERLAAAPGTTGRA
jgi:methyltransferase (TIGR00027 family)